MTRFYNTLLNVLQSSKNVRVMNHEIEGFIDYCNERGIFPQGGAFAMDKKSGKITGQYFYL